MSDQRVIINSPAVVGEIIDGEAIIMCLETGHYYSCDGAGAMIWSWILEGRSQSQISALALARYEAAPEKIQQSLEAFFDQLASENLIRFAPLDETVATVIPDPRTQPREAFTAPALSTYTDMKDLIVLDPIHDVDETGWPTPKGVTEN